MPKQRQPKWTGPETLRAVIAAQGLNEADAPILPFARENPTFFAEFPYVAKYAYVALISGASYDADVTPSRRFQG